MCPCPSHPLCSGQTAERNTRKGKGHVMLIELHNPSKKIIIVASCSNMQNDLSKNGFLCPSLRINILEMFITGLLIIYVGLFVMIICYEGQRVTWEWLLFTLTFFFCFMTLTIGNEQRLNGVCAQDKRPLTWTDFTSLKRT